MPPNDGSGQATQVARDRIDLLRQKLRATPAPVKVVGVAAVLVLVVMTPFLLGRLAYLIVVVPLLYGPGRAGRRVRRRVGARGARAGLARGQGVAAGARRHKAAGQSPGDLFLRDGRPRARRAHGGPGPRRPGSGGGAGADDRGRPAG